MNTSTPLDPRSLAHRLTTVGHALHHRLFAQLRDGDLHPKTVFLLRAIDGRIDAPWVVERLARGGKRVSALADRGWITSTDDGWTLTDEGRAVLDRADAARAALLADVPAEELERLTAALDAVSAALGLDETDGDPRDRPRGTRRRSRLRALRTRLRTGQARLRSSLRRRGARVRTGRTGRRARPRPRARLRARRGPRR